MRISNLSLYFYLQFLTNATTFTLSYAYSCLALWWVQSLVGKLWFLKSCRQSSLWSPAIQNNEKEFFGPTNLFVITLGDPCHEEDWGREKKREFFFRWLDSNFLSRLTLFIGGYWWILPRKFVKNLSSHFQRVFSPQAWNLTRNCLSTYQCKMRNVQSMPCYFLFQHSNCYLQVIVKYLYLNVSVSLKLEMKKVFWYLSPSKLLNNFSKQELREAANFEVDKAMLTDAPLLFPPGQVLWLCKIFNFFELVLHYFLCWCMRWKLLFFLVFLVFWRFVIGQWG